MVVATVAPDGADGVGEGGAGAAVQPSDKATSTAGAIHLPFTPSQYRRALDCRVSPDAPSGGDRLPTAEARPQADGETGGDSVKRGDLTLGVVLIVVGAVLLTGQVFELGGELALLALSAFFFVMYAMRREYGFLVPAGILGGIGVGVLLTETYGFTPNDAIIVSSLAAGFLSIYVIDVVVTRLQRWWPLVPGAILAVVGIGLFQEDTRLLETLNTWWPLALVVIGLAIILGAWRRTPRST